MSKEEVFNKYPFLKEVAEEDEYFMNWIPYIENGTKSLEEILAKIVFSKHRQNKLVWEHLTGILNRDK